MQKKKEKKKNKCWNYKKSNKKAELVLLAVKIMFVAQMGLGHNRLRSRLQSREAESFILKTLGGVDLLLFFFFAYCLDVENSENGDTKRTKETAT